MYDCENRRAHVLSLKQPRPGLQSGSLPKLSKATVIRRIEHTHSVMDGSRGHVSLDYVVEGLMVFAFVFGVVVGSVSISEAPWLFIHHCGDTSRTGLQDDIETTFLRE